MLLRFKILKIVITVIAVAVAIFFLVRGVQSGVIAG